MTKRRLPIFEERTAIAARWPDPVLALSDDERQRRVRVGSDTVLLDDPAQPKDARTRGFVKSVLTVPLGHEQALPGKRHAGLWEVPGGKVDPGETPRAALVREIGEELGLVLDPAALAPAGFVDEPALAGRNPIVLMLYSCWVWGGTDFGPHNSTRRRAA